MKIIAYRYDADVHCIACTKKRTFKLSADSLNRADESALDEHGTPIHAIDSDGKPVYPVFSTDENDFTHCGDCDQSLNERLRGLETRLIKFGF